MNHISQLIKRVSPFLVLLIPLGMILQNPGGFAYPSMDAQFSDMTITHYPNALFIQKELTKHGVIPLWSPAILSGYPFAGNPLSGLWYPPGWVALFFPLPLGFNLSVALHILLGGLGMFSLLRSEDLGTQAALFGGLIFESMPKVFAHYGAGHLTLVYAIAWTPWLLWSARKSQEKGGRMYLLPVIFLSLTILADPRWSVFAGLLWVVYAMKCSKGSRDDQGRNQSQKEKTPSFKVFRQYYPVILMVSCQTLLSLLISSPLILPFIEFTAQTTRVGMEEADLFTFSLPPERLLGFVYPDFGGHHEYVVYTGSAVFLLVIFALISKGKSNRERFWLWSGLIALIYALGSYTPLAPILSNLPGLDLIRAPSRALAITSICMACSASHMVDRILSGKHLVRTKWANLFMVAIVSFIVLCGFGIFLFLPDQTSPFLFGSIAFLIMSVWVGLMYVPKPNWLKVDPENPDIWNLMKRGISKNRWYLVLIILVLLDFGIINISLLAFREKDEVLGEGSEVSQYLAAQEGIFRVYSPSYSLPQSTAMTYGIELADGVDPLQLNQYVDYMEMATGVPVLGYSVTTPPFSNGNPAEDNREFFPDPEALGRLNVAYVVSEYDIDVEGLTLEVQFGDSRIYKNEKSFPRAWVEQQVEGTLYNVDREVPVIITKYRPNRIELTAKGPGALKLSEINYPGWEVIIDEDGVPLTQSQELLRTIPLKDGEHNVVFKFQPPSVLIGLILMGIGILTMGMVIIKFPKIVIPSQTSKHR